MFSHESLLELEKNHNSNIKKWIEKRKKQLTGYSEKNSFFARKILKSIKKIPDIPTKASL